MATENALLAGGGEGQAYEGFLFKFVGFGGAGGGAGAGRALDGAKFQTFALHQLADARHYEEMRAHIFRFFLNPDDFAGVGMLVDGGGEFRAQQRVELVEENNRGGGVIAATALGAQLVAELAADDQDALGVLHFAIGNDGKKARLREVLDAGGSVGMAQHAFGSEDDERLAPGTADLAAQQMKILRSGGRLANLHVFFAGELHKALDARAGMLRPLAFITVGKKQDQAGGKIPFVFAGANELIDDDLRAVDEIAELRFP